ncbi:hypothetical protein NMY22_g3437 [Coprinellus aureogranulatus]|nr:hypothetical protein NMY22_g3437 [Coprinellus aureogranulatus]
MAPSYSNQTAAPIGYPQPLRAKCCFMTTESNAYLFKRTLNTSKTPSTLWPSSLLRHVRLRRPVNRSDTLAIVVSILCDPYPFPPDVNPGWRVKLLHEARGRNAGATPGRTGSYHSQTEPRQH